MATRWIRWNPTSHIYEYSTDGVVFNVLPLNASIINEGTIDPARLPAAGGNPVGSIMMYGGATAPTGYLICDGSAVSRTTYSALFAVLSTLYGAGNGSTTFNLPNLQQRFPLGKATSGTGGTLGETGGAIDHTHTLSGVPQHNHTGTITINPHNHAITDPTHSHTVTSMVNLSGAGIGGGTGAAAGTPSTSAVGTGITIQNTTATGTVTINNAGTVNPPTSAVNPPYVTVNFIIKT